jgi:hypothetical protein
MKFRLTDECRYRVSPFGSDELENELTCRLGIRTIYVVGKLKFKHDFNLCNHHGPVAAAIDPHPIDKL